MLVLAAFLALLVGGSLGLLGGGGSILTLPVLVYVLGVEPRTAIAMSLVVVGTTSAAGAIGHARCKRVRFRTGLLFGAASMAGAFAGGRVAHVFSASTLLVAFAAVMLVTALAMLRGRRAPAGAPAEAAVAKVLGAGAAVGAVAGLVGAGGGFLIVPALTLLGGLVMTEAVGTSLLVIALQSFAGFAGHVQHVQMDWTLTAVVSASAVVGSFAGVRLARRVSPDTLRRGFAWFVLAMSALLFLKQIPWSALGPLRAAAVAQLGAISRIPPVASVAGGLLIGAAASLLLLYNGRIAGISGIFGGLVIPERRDVAWRGAFVAGLLAGGALLAVDLPSAFPDGAPRSAPLIALAGVLVGYGTRLGNGCTSGHGVCGVSRLSARSMVATLVFMASGAGAVLLVRVLGASR